MGFWRPSSSRAVVVAASFRGRCPRLWGSRRCCLDGGGSPYLLGWGGGALLWGSSTVAPPLGVA
eukprot:4236356-Alexandrium_andersonii.AAC.1